KNSFEAIGSENDNRVFLHFDGENFFHAIALPPKHGMDIEASKHAIIFLNKANAGRSETK
ncbi:MAG: hypothetical protein ACK2T5_08520, partial [Anaerolineales bacterium]